MSRTRRLILALLFIIVAGILYFKRTSSPVGNALINSSPMTSTATRTNLVVMGIGGEGHIGADLTDTIIMISLGSVKKDVKVISLPRDLWIDSLKARINTAYHYGQLPLAKSAVEEVLGIPIHYAVVIDFAGFKEIIDSVGGVDINIEKTFDDYLYPIEGKETAEPESARYEHLHFDKGIAHMDGVTALKFARSRHAVGEEGTDFARSARQQKMISALKDKVFSVDNLTSATTMKNVINNVQKSLDTDIKPEVYASFMKFAYDFERSGKSFESLKIEEYLTEPKDKRPYVGAWVLLANEDLKTYVANFLAQ